MSKEECKAAIEAGLFKTSTEYWSAKRGMAATKKASPRPGTAERAQLAALCKEALSLGLFERSTDFWTHVYLLCEGRAQSEVLEVATSLIEGEKAFEATPLTQKDLSPAKQMVKDKLSKWVDFLSKKGVMQAGYCDHIAGSLGDALWSLGYIKGWNHSIFNSWNLSYTPPGCPWKVEHFALHVGGVGKDNWVVDIPMKEYCSFDPSTKKWVAHTNPRFEVHLLQTKEDFLNAYPGMTEEEANEMIELLAEGQKTLDVDDPCLTEKGLKALSA